MTKTKTPMTIGIFTDDFYPNSGGVARSIELQITELTKRGHRVVLCAPNHFFIQPDGVDSEPLATWHIPGTESYLSSLKFGNEVALRLSRKYKFDIIHSQNERGALFLAAKVAKLQGAAHIHTFHSNYASTHETSPFLSALNSFSFMRIAPRILRLIRSDRKEARVRYPSHLKVVESSKLAKLDWKTVATFASYVDAFTSPAQYMIDNINESTNDTIKSRSFVIPNGINDVFARAIRIREDETIRFLSCGRLDPEKRVDVIIRAFAKLPEADTELYILGKGAEEGRLKKLARDLSPKNRIVFLGHYSDHERVANEFANSDVFILGSFRFDTQGMVLGEAASAGSAIIYCDDRLSVGVNAYNSLLTKPDSDGISEGMLALMDDKTRLKQMQSASRLLAPEISQQTMADRFLEAYNETLRMGSAGTNQ